MKFVDFEKTESQRYHNFRVFPQYKLLFIVFIIILALSLFIFIRHDKNNIARSAGLNYAKKQCLQTKRPTVICNNLLINSNPPRGHGINFYEVYVYTQDTTRFNASMIITVNFTGQTKISNFMLVSQ